MQKSAYFVHGRGKGHASRTRLVLAKLREPAECALLGLPMLALYRRGDAEQEMNARLVEAGGIGVASMIEQASDELIRRFEAELESPRQALADKTRAMTPASEAIPRTIRKALSGDTSLPDMALAHC
jgi:hypothetical protein